jgi:hypothetical protein
VGDPAVPGERESLHAIFRSDDRRTATSGVRARCRSMSRATDAWTWWAAT